MRTIRGAIRGATAIAFAFSIVTAASGARADGATDKVRAREAYDRGLEAHRRGDHKKAAEEFARADTLAPSAVALQAAIDAAVDADDPALGAELLDRSKREALPPSVAASVATANQKFAGRTGRLRIRCPAGATCSARLDERVVEMDRILWATTGSHLVALEVDGDKQPRTVQVVADQLVDVEGTRRAQPAAEPPRAAPPPVPGSSESRPATESSAPPTKVRSTGGLRPIVFYAGAGLTVALAVATGYFALSAGSTHDDFVGARCPEANFAGCEGLADDGKDADRMTSIGLLGTAVVGVATAVIGIGLTNWKAPVFGLAPPKGPAQRVGQGLSLTF